MKKTCCTTQTTISERLPEVVRQIHERLERLECQISAQTTPAKPTRERLLTVENVAAYIHQGVAVLQAIQQFVQVLCN